MAETAAGTARVRVLAANRLPRGGKTNAVFFVTALCGPAGEATPVTRRCPASWGASPLGQVQWEAEAEAEGDASAGGTPSRGGVELAFAEVSSDLVLQLRRADDDGKSAGEVLGELCLPLAALAGAHGSRGHQAPLWHELLLKRETHGLHKPQSKPPTGAPGWLRLTVDAQLHDLRGAYVSKAVIPIPERNVRARDKKQLKHPRLGVTAALFQNALQESWCRLDAAVHTLVLGCAMGPLRSACFVQTWRSWDINTGFVALVAAGTSPFAWRYGVILAPLAAWLSLVWNGWVLCKLRALEQPPVWAEVPRSSMWRNVGGAVAGAANTVFGFPSWVWYHGKDVFSVPHDVLINIQAFLISAAETVERLDNALSWVDPLATKLLVWELLKAACTASATLLLVSKLPLRRALQVFALLHLLPMPAHSTAALRALLCWLKMNDAFASGLLTLPEAVSTAPTDMWLPDRVLLRLFPKLLPALRAAAVRPPPPPNLTEAQRKEAEKAKDEAAAAEDASPARGTLAAISRILARVPCEDRTKHIQLNARSFADVNVPIRTRLLVTYDPVVVYRKTCTLQVQLFAEDMDIVPTEAVYPPAAGNAREVTLEFILHMRPQTAAKLVLEPLQHLEEHFPVKWACLNGASGPSLLVPSLPSPQEACNAEQPVWRGEFVLSPRWSDDAHQINGLRTSLQLRVLRSAGYGSLGCVPLQLSFAELPALPTWLLPPPPGAYDCDVFLSYRDIETGRLGDGFALQVDLELQKRGITCFSYAAHVRAGREHLSPVLHGVHASRLFVPICSPGYAHMRDSPATANELLAAWRCSRGARARCAILPVWHSGIFPPEGAAGVLEHAAALRIPTGKQLLGDTVLDFAKPAEETANAIAEMLQALKKCKSPAAFISAAAF